MPHKSKLKLVVDANLTGSLFWENIKNVISN